MSVVHISSLLLPVKNVPRIQKVISIVIVIIHSEENSCITFLDAIGLFIPLSFLFLLYYFPKEHRIRTEFDECYDSIPYSPECELSSACRC